MRGASIVWMAVLLSATAFAQTSAGTAFTYQGQLTRGGQLLTDTADLQFTLWDAPTTPPGSQIGAAVYSYNVSVADGLFTTTIDFGANAFQGDARWLEIAVRSPAGGGTYTTLIPRQELTATPYAHYSLAPWSKSGADLFYTGGNVGIGTNAPGTRLDVTAGMANLPCIRANNSGSGGSGMQGTAVSSFGVQGLSTDGIGAEGASTNSAGVHGWSSNNTGVWGESGSSNPGMSGVAGINQGPGNGVYGRSDGGGFAGFFDGKGYFAGNVGIGTQTPGSPLTVAGIVQSTTGGFEFPDGTLQTSAAEPFSLPFQGTTDKPFTAFQVTNIGTGSAGGFLVNNSVNANPALAASSNGTGPAVQGSASGTGLAGEFAISNAASAATALYVSTSGSGRAGQFEIVHASSENPALEGKTDAHGPAVRGYTTGVAPAGEFTLNNAGSSSPSLYATTNGTGPAIRGNGLIESIRSGFKFPDGTIQTSAATGGTSGWSLTGNAGTDPATNFLGTTDDQALELRVNNARALRIEPSDESPNMIGGYSGNSVTSGAIGAAIGGGGRGLFSESNTVTDIYGTVAGGVGNQAGDGAGSTEDATHATVGGGYSNEATGSYSTVSGGSSNSADALFSTVGGGNTNEASGDFSTVGGGIYNVANHSSSTVAGGAGNYAEYDHSTVSGGGGNVANGRCSTIGGGQLNLAMGEHSTVPGGQDNSAGGNFSFAAGRRAKVRDLYETGDPDGDEGSFVWADASDPNHYFTSTAPNQFLVRATGGVEFVADADPNKGGGLRILPVAAADSSGNRTPNVVNGSVANSVTSGVVGATIAGGGAADYLVPSPNIVTDDYSTVGGGLRNQAGDGVGTTADAKYATIGGGWYNLATTVGSTVGGGYGNYATGISGTIAGGHANHASGYESAVGGGYSNQANGQHSTVSGGKLNDATGDYAVVSGGYGNRAGGDYSLAAGFQAIVRDPYAAGDPNGPGDRGTFVWADYDPNNTYFTSTGSNQFLIRARGGVGIGTNSPAYALHVVGAGTAVYADSSGGDGVQGRSGNASNAGVAGVNTSSGNGVYGRSFDTTNGWAGYFDGRGYFTGNVGIGVTNPSQKLDVGGTARLRSMPTGSGTTVVVDPNGVLLKQSSSRRYKHAVADLPACGDAVLGLRPVSFAWNSTGEADIGLIAEDVADVLPELVICDSDGQPDAVQYDKLALYLLEVVKSQRGTIAAQQTELSDLKQRLTRIESIVAELNSQEEGEAK